MGYFWNSILKTLPSICIPWIVGRLLIQLINMKSFIQMFIFVIFYMCGYCISVWLLGFNNYEKELIHGILYKLKKR